MLRPLNLQFFAEGGESAGVADATSAATDVATDATSTSADATDGAQSTDDGKQTDGNSVDALNAEIARLKAETAKQKDAIDKATKEAGDLRKQLRSKMTQEQIDAAEKQEAADKTARELEDLRRQVAKGNTVKTVMGKLGLDEETAGNLADHLYGAADIENALLEIQKAWQAKEKSLRMEFGKLTGPGSGADSNSPEAQAVKLAADLGKARNAQNEQAQKAMSAYIR